MSCAAQNEKWAKRITNTVNVPTLESLARAEDKLKCESFSCSWGPAFTDILSEKAKLKDTSYTGLEVTGSKYGFVGARYQLAKITY